MCPKLLKYSGADVEILRENQVNVMASDALASCVSRPPVAPFTNMFNFNPSMDK